MIKRELMELIDRIDDEKFLNNMKFIITGYFSSKKVRGENKKKCLENQV